MITASVIEEVTHRRLPNTSAAHLITSAAGAPGSSAAAWAASRSISMATSVRTGWGRAGRVRPGRDRGPGGGGGGGPGGGGPPAPGPGLGAVIPALLPRHSVAGSARQDHGTT